MTRENLRWNRHFLRSGDGFKSLWTELTSTRSSRILLICGAGFDPRALAVTHELHNSGIHLDECRLIEFSSGSGLVSSDDLSRADEHRRHLGAVFPDDSLIQIQVPMRAEDGRSTGGIRISEAFRNPASYAGYSDVVVDITALPAELYFPLIATLLKVWEDNDLNACALGNLHIAVCHNPAVDSIIQPQGGDKADMMYGFPGTLQQASIGNPIRVWAPVLGEHQFGRLERITDYLGADVVAPVLPFPARDPRRGDELLLEYRSLIFDTWEVDSGDIIYADEEDPFDLYTKLLLLSSNYTEALRPIGTVQTVVSSHSSKLHSLGVLLAACEHNFAVAHVQPTTHDHEAGFGPEHREGTLFDIWLAGEAYDEV